MPGCPELELITGFYDARQCAVLLGHFLQEHQWPDNRYLFAGREFVLPRLQTWHADPGIRYSYSNNLLETRPWTPVLLDIRAKVQTFLRRGFNSVLVNCYRDGADHVGWHADNEPELGAEPLIASISFGAERPFLYRRKHAAVSGKLILPSGSLLIMQPEFQHAWRHSVPRQADIDQARINLTFRNVIQPEGVD